MYIAAFHHARVHYQWHSGTRHRVHCKRAPIRPSARPACHHCGAVYTHTGWPNEVTPFCYSSFRCCLTCRELNCEFFCQFLFSDVSLTRNDVVLRLPIQTCRFCFTRINCNFVLVVGLTNDWRRLLTICLRRNNGVAKEL